MYRIKNTGPSTEPRGNGGLCQTPYESVTLSDRLSLIFMDAYFASKKKTKFDPAHM